MGEYLAILSAIIIVVIVFTWVLSKARQILESWAAGNDYQIISSETRWLRRGPFLWTTSKNQVVYYVTVRTNDGTVRQGWVRCGSWWAGVLKDKAEVRWDE
ncbi:hypothetical protein ACFL6S_23265 [Candidatus Poribacteria bacterium]